VYVGIGVCLAPERWRAGVCLAFEGCMDQALIKVLMKALMEAIARKGITQRGTLGRSPIGISHGEVPGHRNWQIQTAV